MSAVSSTLPPFLQSLARGPLVFDGAMGTMLYERGVPLNRCFDEICLSQPASVAEIHRDYLRVGVDVVQTNTYSSNRFALAAHGLADKTSEICRAAVRIAQEATAGDAYIAGSIGPTGLLPKDLLRGRTRRAVFESFREQAQALAESGCHILLFETFGYLGELEIALEASYGFQIPVVAQVSFQDDLKTNDGATPEEAVERLREMSVDVVGANCVLGPERILAVGEKMLGHGIPVVLQPNAGHPRTVDGRSLFLSSAETFGVCARRAFKMGIAAFGGCCGTTPQSLRRAVQAARMCGGGRWRQNAGLAESGGAPSANVAPEAFVSVLQGNVGEGEQSQPTARVGCGHAGCVVCPTDAFAGRSRLAAKIAEKKWAVSVEVAPPTGLNPQPILDKISWLAKQGIDAVNIPDGPRATARMSNLALARMIIEKNEIEPILHMCARDRNLIGLQGDMIAAHALGIRNLILVTGDPPKLGDYPEATAVFDLDSPGMLRIARGFNHGKDPAGKSMGANTQFVLGTGAEPAAIDRQREIHRLGLKCQAGAEVIFTQPVFALDTLQSFLDEIRDLSMPIFVGILPLASSRNAEFLHQNVPGMRIPDEIRDRMRKAGDGQQARKEGVRLAAEALAAVKPLVQGAYIMPPLGRVEMAVEVLEELDKL